MNVHQDDTKQVCWSSAVSGEQGISLVEVMAALFISLLVIGAAFTAVVTTEKAAVVNERVAHAQQNVRVAMEFLARDLKMAGFGMTTGAIGACASPIVPGDNNPAGADTGPDAVSMVLPTTNANATVGPLWELDADRVGPFNDIVLRAGAVQAMVDAGLADGDTISIGGALSNTIATGGIDTTNDKLTLTNQIGAPKTFPAGTQVQMLECVSYAIAAPVTCGGNEPCLMRNGVSIVDGIEDLQLAYACDGCVLAVNGGVPDGIPDDQPTTPAGFDVGDFVTNSTWGLAPLTPDKIRLVEINVVARAQGDEGLGEARVRGNVSPNPVILSDHDPSATL